MNESPSRFFKKNKKNFLSMEERRLRAKAALDHIYAVIERAEKKIEKEREDKAVESIRE